jgi:hypothetical protein
LILVVACRHPIHLDIDTDDWQERAAAERAETVRLAESISRDRAFVRLLGEMRGRVDVVATGPDRNAEGRGSPSAPLDGDDATGVAAVHDEGDPPGRQQLEIGF